MEKGRLWQMDLLRCAALLNMLLYHGMYDWVYVLGRRSSWYDIWSPGCHVWQQYICWSFILLSGVSFGFSRKPWKNGLIVTGCAVVLTAVTLTVMPSERILFGVLHFLGLAALITWAVQPLLKKVPAGAGLLASALLFALTNQVPNGYLGFEGLKLFALPAWLYRANLYPLGLPDLARFWSADYFPLVPWLFLFWCGWFFYRLAGARLQKYRGAPPAALRPFCALGAHTLLVYMLHQPVLYGLTLLLAEFLP